MPFERRQRVEGIPDPTAEALRQGHHQERVALRGARAMSAWPAAMASANYPDAKDPASRPGRPRSTGLELASGKSIVTFAKKG